MASVASVMAELEAMGTAQNRKIYARHGASGEMFGVSFANLKTLTKKHKLDHDLALELYKTGNMDAQVLAAMIADPQKMRERDVRAWVKKTTYHMVTNYIGSCIVAVAPWGKELAEEWRSSDNEWEGHTGWVAMGAGLRNQSVGREEARVALKEIEAGIHQAPNRKKEAMNGVLIGIGLADLALTNEAIAAAERIGKVEVDHGDTSCKTPYAVDYIVKGLARKGGKRSSPATKKGSSTNATKTGKKGSSSASLSKAQSSRVQNQGGAMKKASKTTGKKKAAKKTVKKAAKKSTAKKAAKKTTAKKAAKKTAKKAAKKSTAKKAAKKSTAKKAAKKTTAKKAAKKSTAKKAAKKTTSKRAAKKAPAAPAS